MTEMRIPSGAYVLDVGSGDHPHRRADVLCDRFLDGGNTGRRHASAVIDRPFVLADATALPFADNAFDYVICSCMVEQVDNAGQALDESSRVGKAGHISTYTEINEFLTPLPANRWAVASGNGVLVMKRMSGLHRLGVEKLYGALFWHLHGDRYFRRFMFTHKDLFWVEFEWEGRVNYCLLPESHQLHDYSDPSVVARLARYTPPGSLLGRLKRMIRVHGDTAWLASVLFRARGFPAPLKRLICAAVRRR